MAKITPDLAKSDKPFQTLFNRMFLQPQRKLHWMKDTTLSHRKNTSEAFAKLSLESSKMATSKTDTGIIYNEIMYDPYKTEIHSIPIIIIYNTLYIPKDIRLLPFRLTRLYA